MKSVPWQVIGHNYVNNRYFSSLQTGAYAQFNCGQNDINLYNSEINIYDPFNFQINYPFHLL